MGESTYRERRLAKAERLRGWAEKREAKSSAAFESSQQLADMIPFGQPILVGHHSEGRHRRDLDRIHSRMDKALEHSRKAEDMQRWAEGIERAAEHAIYSDDVDAVQRLGDKIASLEAERTAIKAYNASCRKGSPDMSLLPPHLAAKLKAAANAGQVRDDMKMPGYVLSNLGGTINTAKKRLASLQSQ